MTKYQKGKMTLIEYKITLLTPNFSQKGHFCLTLCLVSTFTSLSLAFFPYLDPNLPADFVFFDFVVIFVKWGCPDLNRGHEVPNLIG